MGREFISAAARSTDFIGDVDEQISRTQLAAQLSIRVRSAFVATQFEAANAARFPALACFRVIARFQPQFSLYVMASGTFLIVSDCTCTAPYFPAFVSNPASHTQPGEIPRQLGSTSKEVRAIGITDEHHQVICRRITMPTTHEPAY
ncbi:hypothetical protein ACNUDN_28120 [Mycobacterium sp. smrl_JER01]|uniref:hypothetical protein n=1 Tax=Mycobacterium sp. smrl_JER01 TaxID=3402633 RepID=UPI003AC3D6CE